MIYISSSCVRSTTIKESIEKLVALGYRNIELSGGTRSYSTIEDDLISLKSKCDLNYLIHNYFPPPKDPFILNIGSLNETIHTDSVNHAKRAIDLAKKIGANKYGIHAGFFFDPNLKQIGKKMDKTTLVNRDAVIDKFCETYKTLAEYAGNIPVYIENNVLSKDNFTSFDNKNPFMLTHYEEYIELQKRIDFPMILDLAHLYVSCNSLKLNFEEQVEKFTPKTDYIHISDNNGLADTNKSISDNSAIFNALTKIINSGKTLTLEIYENPEKMANSYQLIEELTKR